MQLGGATHRAGRFGPGLHFQGGAAAAIASSDDFAAGPAFTLALWARPESPAASRQVVFAQGGERRGAVIAIEHGRWLAGAWQDGAGAWLDLGPAVAGQWQHLALAQDAAGILHGYVDGLEMASAPAGGTVRLESAGASLGGAAAATRLGASRPVAAGSGGFHGDLDEFRFFPHAVAPADLSVLALRRWP